MRLQEVSKSPAFPIFVLSRSTPNSALPAEDTMSPSGWRNTAPSENSRHGQGHELIITGRFIGAEEALRIGLANEVVPKGMSLKRAKELAHEICKLPQGAMRTDKQAALMGYGRPLEEGLRIEAEVGQTVLDSFDIVEGASAFAQKRKPSFKQDG